MPRGLVTRGALLLGLLTAAAVPATKRFLYVVGCDARIDKIDTVTGRRDVALDLARRTGGAHVIPQSSGAIDGCLAYDAIYDAKDSVFYTIVPAQARLKEDGARDYRVLAFSVPRLRLEKMLPGRDALAGPPHLALDAEKRVTVVDGDRWSPVTALDVSGFKRDGQPGGNEILESSGASTLLRIFAARSDRLVLAVADARSRTVVPLQGIPFTTARHAHLSPGGGVVLVEETGQDGSEVRKTGRLSLFDARTGTQVEELLEPRVKDLVFLAISPTGRAIYHSAHAYSVFDLKRKFDSVPVTRPFAAGYPAMFFADR